MLLVSWLRDLGRRRMHRRRNHRSRNRNEVPLCLMRLEDRQVLSASGLAVLDVGDTLATAHETGLGPGSGTFSQAEALGNGATGSRDVDLYRFEAAAGARLIAETARFGDSLPTDTILRLFDAGGSQLAFNDDRDFAGGDFFSQIDFTFAATGTYFIGVSGFNNSFYDPEDGSGTFAASTGEYRLTLRLTSDAGDVGDTLATALDTGLGPASGVFVRSEVLGNSPLGGADIDLYRFEAMTGDTLTVSTARPAESATLANTFVRLFDANANQLAFDDDSGPGLYSRLQFTFDQAGTYYVGVSAFPNIFYNAADPLAGDATEPLFAGTPGEYRLTMFLDTGDTLADARETGIGTTTDTFTRTERLGDGPFGLNDVDVYRIVAAEGDVLQAATFLPAGSIQPVDTVLRLFDESGSQIAFNNDRDAAGGDSYSALEFTFANAGTYYVAVSAFPNDAFDPTDGSGTVAGTTAGEYRLELTLTQAAALAEIRGVKFNDANGNRLRDEGEEGVAGVTIFLDTNGNGVLDREATTFSSTDVPQVIPEQFDPIVVVSELTVSGLAGAIVDIDVTLNITHTFDSDLEVYLVSPSGTFIQLFAGVGGAEANFTGTILDDQAATPIAAGDAPFTGRFRPQEPLSTFHGEDPTGTWQLVIIDTFPEEDGGSLDSWSLSITTDQSTPTEPTTVTDADGSYAFTGLVPGTYRVGEVLPDGFVQTFPSVTPIELLRADFSDGSGAASADGFVTSGFFGFVNQWHVSTGRGGDAGHSPPHSFYFGSGEGLGGGGSYANDAFGVLTSPTIDLAGITDARILLEFNHFLDIEDFFDSVGVAIVVGENFEFVATSEDFGTVSFDFATFSDRRSTAGFEAVSLDITSFAGQQVQVEFEFFSDSSVTFEGWYVDDVAVRVVPSGLHTVTLAAGEIRDDVDFGNRVFNPAEIRGTKFLDLGGDGVRDPDEPGLGGAVIFLDLNGNGVLDRDQGEPFTTTAADGSYVFTGLEPGTYLVAELVGPGFEQTFPAAPGTHTVAVAAGETATDIDFGNRIVATAQISGTVFNDFDGGGRRDAGEPGVGGVEVTLERIFASADVPTPISDFTTVTSDLLVLGLDGRITDLNVALDITHTFVSDLDVFLVSPTGTRVLLFAGVGGSGQNFTGTVLDDEALVPIEFGEAPFSGRFVPMGTLAAFDGEDPDGLWRLQITDSFGGDVGALTGWSLEITTDSPLDGPRQTLTDAGGNYTFDGLFPGTYRVHVSAPGAVQTSPVASGGTLIEVFRADFDDGEGNPSTDGFTSGRGPDGFIDQWHVTTNRGNDPGHSGPGSFYFGDEFASGGPEYANDAHGRLVSPLVDLPQLAAGQQILLEFNHFLEIEDFFDFVNVNILVGANRTEVASEDDFGTVDFFTFARSTNGFEAVSIDISQFAGERIQIEFEFFSDFSVTFEGWYIDDVVVSLRGVEAAAHVVTLAPGAQAGGFDFGLVGTAAISGKVFADLNGNGVRDADENALPGTTVFLDLNGNGILDGAGTFHSTDVPRAIPDLGTVSSVVQVSGLAGDIADVNVTIDVAHTFVGDLDVFLISPTGTRMRLVSGEELFDFFGANFTGTTFDDEAAQSITFAFAPFTGRFQPTGSLALFDGQNPNGQWTLEITDAFEFDTGVLLNWSLEIVTTDAEPHVTTAPDGSYVFAGLLPGQYTVAQVALPGFVLTQPTGGAHVVTLADNEVRGNLDFANQGARLSGVSFLDLNGNGVRDANEPGLAGVIIQVVDSQGRVVAQTVTLEDDLNTPGDETGAYMLDVGAGSFLVREIVPAGFAQTAPGLTGAVVQQFTFEGGAEGFTATGQWHRSTGRGSDPGHSPQFSFYFGAGEGPAGGGRYANNQSGTLTSPLITLPAADRLFLEFNHLLAIEDFFDTASVTIISGGVRTVIADNNFVGGLPDFTDGFQRASFDVSQFAGQAVRIEFSFTSDVSITFEGWYVDDVTIVSGAPTGAHAVTLARGQTRGGLNFGNTDADRFPDTLAEVTAPNVTLRADQVVSLISFLDYPEDVDVFRFVAPQTGFIAVRMTEPGFAFQIDPFLRLFDANGNLLEVDDDGAGFLDSLLTFEVTAGQTFFVEASHSPFAFTETGGTGVYQIEFISTGPAAPVAFQSIGGSEFVGTASGTLANPGQVQVFAVTVPAGAAGNSLLTIDLAAAAGSPLDTVLTVFDADTGDLIATNDDFFPDPFNFNSRVVLAVGPGDEFFVVAGGFLDSTGAFNLTARVAPNVGDDFPNTVATAFPLGAIPAAGARTQNGTIEIAGDIDAFRFEVPAGPGLLTIDLVATGNASLDPILELRNATTGQLIAFNDDFGGTLNSRIQRQTTGGEQFVVLARGFGTTTGTYTLTIRREDVEDDFPGIEDLGLLVVGFTQPGRIEVPGDVDIFRIEIPEEFAAQTLQIRQSAAPLTPLDPRVDTLLRVFDAAGNLVAFNDDIGFTAAGGFSLDSQTSITVRPGDVFFVHAGAFGSSTGRYVVEFLTADDFPDTPTAAHALGNLPAAGTLVQPGVIEFAGDRDLFSFTATADGRVTLRLGDANPGVASLDDLEGTLLTVLQEFETGKFRTVAFDASSTGQSQVVLSVDAGDTYVIQAAGFGLQANGTQPQTGAYELSIETGPVPGAADLGDTFADAAFVYDPTLPDLGLDPGAFTLHAGDVDVVRFVARATGVATVGLTRPEGSTVEAGLAAFVFVADPLNDSLSLPQRIASDFGLANGPDDGTRTLTFNVTAGVEYAIRVSALGGTSGDYQLSVRTEDAKQDSGAPAGDGGTLAGQFLAGTDGMLAVGNAVFQAVRQLRLTLPEGITDQAAANQLIDQAVATFLQANGFDASTSFLVLVLDPVDGVLTEPGSGSGIGFNAGQGQINEFGSGFFSGDGVVEVLILPTVERSFNLSLAGVGSNFLFDARLVTPGGPSGGMSASVTLAGTGQSFSARGGSSDLLLGGLNLVLDFTATGPITPPGPPVTGDVGLAFALSSQPAVDAAGAIGAALGSPAFAFSAEAAQALAQLSLLQSAADHRPDNPARGGWDRMLQSLWEGWQATDRSVQNVLETVGEWIDDATGVPAALAQAWEALPEEADVLWKRRQSFWSSVGARQPNTPLKLFLQLREALQRFVPAVQAPAESTPPPAPPAPADADADRGGELPDSRRPGDGGTERTAAAVLPRSLRPPVSGTGLTTRA